MTTPVRSKSVVKRTISSTSLKAQPVMQVGDDMYSVGDNEFHIEYHNVPRKFLMFDTFHSLIQFQFFPLLVVILSLILLFIFIFAAIYLGVSDACGLELNSMSEAWLFALLVHLKSVLSSAKPGAQFWHGCAAGIPPLFSQLFIGNILMSVLLSSLVFNFQSISRRNKSLFTTITIGQNIGIAADENSEENEFILTLPVVELNESETRKVTGVIANVFVFDPKQQSITALATNVPLEVTVPADLTVSLPEWLYAPPTQLRTRQAATINTKWCEVCGKSFGKKHQLQAHLWSNPDEEHQEVLKEFSMISQAVGEKASCAEVVNRVRRHQLEFIVIIEGSDPITSDRIQIQKIYRNFSIVDGSRKTSRGINEEDGVAEIDYRTYL